MTSPRRAPRVLGLMSGTSADGVDAVLLELSGWPEIGSGGARPDLTGAAPRGQVVAHQHLPYPDDLREAVLRAARGEARTPNWPSCTSPSARRSPKRPRISPATPT
jgi:anhydro-N-acetylmuramic acid kinase